MEPAIIIAIITGILTLSGSVFAARYAYRAQKESDLRATQIASRSATREEFESITAEYKQLNEANKKYIADLETKFNIERREMLHQIEVLRERLSVLEHKELELKKLQLEKSILEAEVQILQRDRRNRSESPTD